MRIVRNPFATAVALFPFTRHSHYKGRLDAIRNSALHSFPLLYTRRIVRNPFAIAVALFPFTRHSHYKGRLVTIRNSTLHFPLSTLKHIRAKHGYA